MDCSPPGSSVHGIFQTRILELVVISHSRGSSWPRDQTYISYVSCIGRGVYHQHHLGSSVSIRLCFRIKSLLLNFWTKVWWKLIELTIKDRQANRKNKESKCLPFSILIPIPQHHPPSPIFFSSFLSSWETKLFILTALTLGTDCFWIWLGLQCFFFWRWVFVDQSDKQQCCFNLCFL